MDGTARRTSNAPEPDRTTDLRRVESTGRRFGPPATRLAVAAAVCAVLMVGGLLVIPTAVTLSGETGVELPRPDRADWWLALVVLLLQCAILLLSERLPVTTLVAVAFGPFALAWLAPGPVFSLGLIPVLFAVYLVAVGTRMRRIAPALVVAVLAVAAGQFVSDVHSGYADVGAETVTGLVQGVVVVGIPLLIAVTVAARREAVAARTREVAALRREHDALVQAALSRERASLSRELHDIAAHHLSGIALLASAMARQVDADPDEAKRSALLVRTQSTSVLDDLRRLVGLLREGTAPTQAAHSLGSIGELVETVRGTGVAVELTVIPMPDDVGSTVALGTGIGPLTQLVAYRMVQESLANAVAHAPGASCAVLLDDRDAERLVITVENGPARLPGSREGSGFGLLGMRERADLVGAELEYGPTDDDGWRVRLALPRDTVATETATAPDPDESSSYRAIGRTANATDESPTNGAHA